MKNKITEDIKVAMRNKDKEKLAVLRGVKGAIQMKELDLKKELDDSEVTAIISKEIKSRNESISEFKKGNRDDLILKTQSEINILNEYMPELMSEEEISNIVEGAIKELNPTMKDMGRVMGYVTPKVKGKADMGLVSKVVKEKLSQL